MLKNYFNTFNDFNNINWFSQSDIIKKSKQNDVILYHMSYFFNYFDLSTHDIEKYLKNNGVMKQ